MIEDVTVTSCPSINSHAFNYCKHNQDVSLKTHTVQRYFDVNHRHSRVIQVLEILVFKMSSTHPHVCQLFFIHSQCCLPFLCSGKQQPVINNNACVTSRSIEVPTNLFISFYFILFIYLYINLINATPPGQRHGLWNISNGLIRSSHNDSIGFWPPGSQHTLSADGHI